MASTPFTRLQGKGDTATHASVTTVNLTYSSNCTAGSLLVGWVWLNGTVTSPSASDDKGQTWTVQNLAVTSGGTFLVCYFINNASTSTPKLTISWTTSRTTGGFAIEEYTIPTNYAFDVSATSHKSSGTGVTVNPGTPSGNNSNAFTYWGMWNSGANNLTDPPTASPANTNVAIGSHGKISTSIWATAWGQSGGNNISTGGFVVSSSTETSDVFGLLFTGVVSPFVQKATAANSGSNSCTATFGSAAGAGDCLFACVTYNLTGNSPTGEPSTRTLSDGTNTWVEAIHAYDATDSLGISLWYCLSAAASNPGLTISISGNFTGTLSVGALRLLLSEYSTTGLTGMDGSSSQTSTNSSTFPAGSFTTAGTGDLILYGVGPASSVAATWKTVTNLFVSGAGNGVAAYGTQAAAGAINPEADYSGSGGLTAIAAAFALSPAPAAGTTFRRTTVGFGS